jgi:catechol-2,3-dioxygenase|tara:strand:+ start:3075 stop:3485 length:411 start_codon:yes stop_codon:yes gene_type:complete
MMERINFTSKAIDIGIVTSNKESILNFYENILGFTNEVQIPFPGLGTVNKISYGIGYIKVLVLDDKPSNTSPIGDFSTSNGIRYITINLSNLDELITICSKNNVAIINSGMTIRPGVTVALIQDPDGNLIELMQTT